MFLEKDCDFIEWELSEDADVVSIRFSLPVVEEALTDPVEIVLYPDNEELQRVTLSREHMWVFGNDTDRFLRPAGTDHCIDSDLTPRKAWDTVAVKLSRSVEKRTRLRIGKRS